MAFSAKNVFHLIPSHSEGNHTISERNSGNNHQDDTLIANVEAFENLREGLTSWQSLNSNQVGQFIQATCGFCDEIFAIHSEMISDSFVVCPYCQQLSCINQNARSRGLAYFSLTFLIFTLSFAFTSISFKHIHKYQSLLISQIFIYLFDMILLVISCFYLRVRSSTIHPSIV